MENIVTWITWGRTSVLLMPPFLKGGLFSCMRTILMNLGLLFYFFKFV